MSDEKVKPKFSKTISKKFKEDENKPVEIQDHNESSSKSLGHKASIKTSIRNIVSTLPKETSHSEPLDYSQISIAPLRMEPIEYEIVEDKKEEVKPEKKSIFSFKSTSLGEDNEKLKF